MYFLVQYQDTFGAYLPKHTIWITLHILTKLNSSQICISHKQFRQQLLKRLRKRWLKRLKRSIHYNSETVEYETVTFILAVDETLTWHTFVKYISKRTAS